MQSLFLNHGPREQAVGRFLKGLALSSDRAIQSNPLTTDIQSLFTFFTKQQRIFLTRLAPTAQKTSAMYGTRPDGNRTDPNLDSSKRFF